MKIKIPVNKNKMAVIYTKDIVSVVEVERLIEFMKAVDWNKKWVILPSEYIEKVEFINGKEISDTI